MKNNKINSFTVTGHSGCENTAPNSVESIIKAYESGCEITEIDIRFNSVGTPVLSHDADNPDAVTLEEAFRATEPLGNLRLNLDIKETSHLENIVPLAKKYNLTDRVFCTGVFAKDTDEMKKQLPGFVYYLNMQIKPRFLHNRFYYKKICRIIKENGAVGLNCHHKNITKKLVEFLHINNIEVSVWTVDKKEDMKRVLTLGTDNITTRHPSELINMIKEQNNG